MKAAKAIKGISLRTRLTVLVTAILSVVCVSITALSYYNAYSGMRSTAADAITMAADVLPGYYLTAASTTANPKENSSEMQSAEGSPADSYITEFELSPLVRDTMVAQTLVAPRILFLRQSLLIMLCVIIISALLVYWASGKALKPVTELADSIEKVSEDNLSDRVSINSSSKEAMALAGSFNTMLDRLEEAFLLQKQFAASAAHELKTPLASIQANIETLYLDETPSREDYKEVMDIVSKNTSRLTVLVEQLLSITRRQDMEMCFCDLDSIAKSAIEKVKKQYADAQIDIVGNAGEITGSSELLEQMIYNLLQNAEKYAGENAKTTLTLSRSGDTVSIDVEDSGFGISEDAMAHIFEPFYRAENSRSRKMGGSGLGLAIVKTIAEKHGGTAKVSKSKLGGAEFIVTLKA
ncbi:MAG: HAMP domain-containing sensor histidine kinase [Oscillospiraceae bacterium]